jgi:hypothetical protein
MYWPAFFVIVAIVLLLFFVAFSCAPTPMPYSSTGFFPKLGFAGYSEGFSNYSTYPGNVAKDIPTEGSGATAQQLGDCRRLTGFDGVFCSPTPTGVSEAKNPVDIFSQASGSQTCQSYGYMNSRGYLCMDQEQIRLLRSRGGNATGVEDMNVGLSVTK